MDVSVDARTRLAALFGYPVEHSLSPLIHNTAFRELGLNFVYVALKVAPTDVYDAVKALRALQFAGANVTAPHKRAVIPALDELSEQARAISAVNTITCRTDPETGEIDLVGDNTDVAGFLAPLAPYARQLEGTAMVILGAGGAARAVAYALATTFRPERLTLAARTPSRAESIVADLASHAEATLFEVRPLENSRERVRGSSLVVNATTAGTSPRVDETPWSRPDDFGREHIVYDLVYNPEQTRLLQDASARGAATIGGLDMLIQQAAAAFELWTGTKMPIEKVRDALRQQNQER